MKNFSGRPTFFGIIAVVLGVLALAIAAYWKNAIVNREQTMDEYIAATGVDALIIGAFVIIGGLLIIGGIILVVIGWFSGQQQKGETYTSDASLQPGAYPTPESTAHSPTLPPVQEGSAPAPGQNGAQAEQSHSPRL